MALSIVVSKRSVRFVQEKLWSITFNIILNDSTKTPQEVINQDVSCEYRQGDNPAQKVTEIKEKIQDAVNRYKAEQFLFNAAALDTAVNTIKAGINL